jgi:CheY-like chemotaxis protein
MTGYELLHAVESTDVIVRPPVVIYTGKDISKEEMDGLRRFSESIIIKGARSEERLLDEVSLFLHYVVTELPQEQQQMLERVRHREEIFEGKRLLIVDDDMRNVFALRSVLLKRGFEIFVGKDGVEALEKLREHPDIDVVLMDIMMPRMDGYEAMRQIRLQEHFKTLPIIALTAKAMKADREKCLEAGANDYLPKPVNMDSLLSLLRIWLTR